jgi:hypothetical protein
VPSKEAVDSKFVADVANVAVVAVVAFVTGKNEEVMRGKKTSYC